jgi:hypothetical protein
MCVSVAQARFTGTILYAGEAMHHQKAVHVLGYQNTVQNRAEVANSGNAMLLHFPAVPGSMTPSNVIETAQCPNVLGDMVRALQEPTTGWWSPEGTTASRVAEVFDTGIYTVVLASDARTIPEALNRVPRRKRPPLNAELFDWYERTFPGWPVALCCFDAVDAVRATPMMWWYEPTHPEFLFAPAIDSHTGAPPNLDAEVAVDHWVVLGCRTNDMGRHVYYSDLPPPPDALTRGSRTADRRNSRALSSFYRSRRGREIASTRSFLPTTVWGRAFHGLMPNADFVGLVNRPEGFEIRRSFAGIV